MHELQSMTYQCHTLFISLGSLGDKFKEEQQKHAKITSYPSLHKIIFINK